MSMCIWTAQTRTKRRPHFWARAFSQWILASNYSSDISMCISTAQPCRAPCCKLWHKMALVRCPCEFRLRRLAESGCHSRGGRHFCVISRTKWPSMCISTAQSRARWLSRSWGAMRSSSQDLADIFSKTSRSLALGPWQKILWRSWWNPLLSKMSLHEALADAMSWRCLSLNESSCGGLLGGSCIKILQDLLQQQASPVVLAWRPLSRSCTSPHEQLSCTS